MDTSLKRDDGRMLAVIYLIIMIDAAGIGLVLPVLPDLLRSLGGQAATGWPFGAFLGLYALMQFLFSPLLGSLSDRFGRRRILLLSLAGAALNYGVMAMHPPLWLLFVGRAIAGMTGANMAVASAYLADITPPERRGERFGRLNAFFGLGFIIGPAVGGVMSQWGLGYPFMAAAVVSLLALVMALLLLPRTPPAAAVEPFSFNPLASFRWVFAFPVMLPPLAVFTAYAMVGEVGSSIWVLYGETRFHWTGLTVGLSLGLFGFFHALAQAFLTGPLSRRLGQRWALLLCMACDGFSYVAIAVASSGWLAFALIPVFCIGGIGAPILEGLLSNGVDDDGQGRLRGVMGSLTSLASIVTPVAVAAIFFASRSWFPGLVWVMGAGLYLLCLPAILGLKAPRGGGHAG